MLKNYLKIALRTLTRQKLYAAINVLSLAIGLACCALILLYVRHETTADGFHDRADRIFRVYRVEQRTDGTTKRSAGVPTPLGPALAADLPGVERAVRLRRGSAQVHRPGDGAVFSETVLFSDPGFFALFSFPLAAGQTAPDPLAAGQQVVLSEAMARKYFGAEDAVGQPLTVRLGETPQDFTVAGVAAAPPANSSITFDVLVPFAQWPGYAEQAERWTAFNAATYLLLQPDADAGAVGARLAGLVPHYFAEAIAEAQERGWWRSSEDAFQLRLQALPDVHFATGFTNMVAATRDPEGLYLLGGIALVVLLLACVNAMTLAAGRAGRRAQEIGVRKTMGAHRMQLARQFWGEALLLSVFALALGLVLAEALLPLFSELAGTRLAFHFGDVPFLLGLGAVVLVSSLIAGSYPALVLSAFRPADVLKGEVRFRRGLTVTRALVVFQFVVSIGMIAGTLVMYDQLDYLTSKNLGFAGEEVIVLDLNARQTDEDPLLARLHQRLAGHPDVVAVSGASYAFGDGWARMTLNQDGRQHIAYRTRVEPSYLETLGMDLVAGRNLSAELETDREHAVLINETMARELGWDDPVGQTLPEHDDVEIVGVVADYHFQSLHNRIAPVFLHLSPSLDAYTVALVRVRTEKVAETLAFLRETWSAVAPGQPFAYEFLDQRLDALYAAEVRWSRIVQTAALFAILIACLGLFGLATLSVGRRTKEIGIRKILGASVPALALLLSRDFAALVGLAFVLACPLAYLAVDRWLDGFAYHTAPTAGAFLLAGALALAVALITVSYQAVRAALADPVDSLRYE
ncbi:MAG: ABC transporter permease [Rhodothermales bacterium]|nr:ABC transporter permease [Rhodothermales bacterium]